MSERKSINISAELYDEIKDRFPGENWTEIMSKLRNPENLVTEDGKPWKEDLDELKKLMIQTFKDIIATNGLKTK